MTEHRKLLEKGPRRVSPYFIPMMIPNMRDRVLGDLNDGLLQRP